MESYLHGEIGGRGDSKCQNFKNFLKRVKYLKKESFW